MEKIEKTLRLTNEYNFCSSFGEGHIYRFIDKCHNVYVCKTSSPLFHGDYITRGSVIEVKGFVKGQNTYKGEHQTVLTRVKIVDVLEMAPTKKEIERMRAENQMNSLRSNDIIREVTYREYKNEYADCETVAGSYNSYVRPATIKVIIRGGKN